MTLKFNRRNAVIFLTREMIQLHSFANGLF
jgi:hypothetical protein